MDGFVASPTQTHRQMVNHVTNEWTHLSTRPDVLLHDQDVVIASRERISYPRMMIEADVSTSFPECVDCLLPDGTTFAQVVIYEWRPWYCKHCELLGHDSVVYKKVQQKWVPKPLNLPANPAAKPSVIPTTRPSPAIKPQVRRDLGPSYPTIPIEKGK